MTYGFRISQEPTFKELANRAKNANAKLSDVFRESLRELGTRFVELAGQEARGGQSGTIGRGIFYRTYVRSGLPELRVYPGKIGAFHLHGTGIHGPVGKRITPLSATALRWENGTEVVYATSTQGVKPDAFFGRAYRRWLPGARVELRKISQAWLRELAGRGGKGVSL